MGMSENTSGQRLLIVDDDKHIHEDIIKILMRSSSTSELDALESDLFGETESAKHANVFEIDSAFQGKEGLQLVREARESGRPYAMAFVDMRMPPGWDGVETIEHLWREDPDLQIVICTAHSDRSWPEIIDRLGTTDRLLILKKPFDTVEISQMAQALTQKWALHLASREKFKDLDELIGERTRALEIANADLKKEMREREHMETELRLAQKLESIGQLAAGIAHEINTPTQYVGDNTRFLEEAFVDIQLILEAQMRLLEAANEGAVNAALVEEVEAIIQAADMVYLNEEIPRAISESLDGTARIAKIVAAMKQLSHPGSDEKQVVDLNRVIESATTVSCNEWKFVADLSLELDANLPMVNGYAAELGQVFLNLTVNAAHAIADRFDEDAKEKGRITISTQCVDGVAVARVIDNGAGIPDSLRDKVFDSFFTTKEVGKGTGQGLSIAHSVVVDKHGGKLELETDVGVGTTFTIHLPVCEDVPLQDDDAAFGT